MVQETMDCSLFHRWDTCSVRYVPDVRPGASGCAPRGRLRGEGRDSETVRVDRVAEACGDGAARRTVASSVPQCGLVVCVAKPGPREEIAEQLGASDGRRVDGQFGISLQNGIQDGPRDLLDNAHG